MKTLVLTLFFFIITGCSPKIYLTNSTLNKDELKNDENCTEMIDFISYNMFYIERDNSYLLSYGFSTILTRRYLKCLSELNFNQIEMLFGKPSCKSTNQLCYYLYLNLPKGVSNNDVNVVERPSITFTKSENKIKLGGECKCDI